MIKSCKAPIYGFDVQRSRNDASNPRRCESRDSTNQNALFVEWFSRLERADVVYGVNFALFQAWIGNFDTIPPWIGVGTLNFDSSYVTFKYFAFLSVCDKFELLGQVQAATTIWALFRRSSWIHCWLLLAVLSDFFGHLVSSTILLCKFWDLPGPTADIFPFMRCWKCLGLKRWSQPSSRTFGKRAEKTYRNGSWKRVTPPNPAFGPF